MLEEKIERKKKENDGWNKEKKPTDCKRKN